MLIDITGVDLKAFVKKVYELSKPQGMGMLHYQEGGLPDNEATEIINKAGTAQHGCILHMDYVRGRSCKMGIYKEGDRLQIRYPWYDHTDADLLALLMHVGVGDRMPIAGKVHSPGCTCGDCRVARARE